MVFRTSSGLPQLDEAALLRLICHYALSKIPDEGLPEVVRLLADSSNYYLEEANRQRALAPVPEIVKAKVARRYDRPAFGLTEE